MTLSSYEALMSSRRGRARGRLDSAQRAALHRPTGRPHPDQRIDVIHSRIRLSVMAILASVNAAAFTYLRDKVGATDGNLATQSSRPSRSSSDWRACCSAALASNGSRRTLPG